MSNEIAIVKCNHRGQEVFRYHGKVLERRDGEILLEARFGLLVYPDGRQLVENVRLVDIPMNVGDRFLETYYADKWFNIYEIHAHDDDRLKAWYCNVAYPAVIGSDLVTFRDLALDLLVYPDGRQQVLDEEEFAALDISSSDKTNAETGLAVLQRHFRQKFAK